MKKMQKSAVAISAAAMILSAQAQEKKVEEKKVEEKVVRLDTMKIIGSTEKELELIGSGTYIDGKQNIADRNYTDIKRILNKVPGVHVREEDGYGLFPNISMRGVDSARSGKITMMEDGILTAPAAYSAPSAYYAPISARMSGLEVLKGSSSVAYGPHTTGGVLNYLSTPITDDQDKEYGSFYSKQTYGSNSDWRSHNWWSKNFQTDAGVLGVLFEYYHRENDGFKDIQHSSKNSGINGQDDANFKLRFEPKSDMYQYFEMKLGYTDMDYNESYVGISDEDFGGGQTYDRYWGSQWDNYKAHQFRSYLTHFIELSESTSLQTTAYYSKFHRNWYKLSKVNGNDISKTIGAGGSDLDVLKGEGSGDLTVKANNRDYTSRGIQTVLRHQTETGDIGHDIQLGARLHADAVKRKQWEDTYSVVGTTVTGVTSTPKGSAGDREQSARAISVYLSDQIALTDKFTITPGVRYEEINYKYKDLSKTDRTSTTRDQIWVPGIGFTYALSNEAILFGGVHKGISTVSPKDAATNDIKNEESVGTEFGIRFNDNSGIWNIEAAAFYTDISNLYDPESTYRGTATGSTLGDAVTWGFEVSGQYDLGKANGWSFSNPWTIAATWTDASLDANDDRDGNEIPYIPEFQATIGTGLHWDKFGVEVAATYVSPVYTTIQNDEYTDGGDAAVGRLDQHLVVDASAYYDYTENVRVIASIENAFDEKYEAARHSDGLRPGAPMTAALSLELQF